jgi:hypothetical protein
MARRSIYSRRQSMPAGTYDTPLADFLDALPQYINQYQQNQLALQRQELADKRYEDSIERQQRQDQLEIERQEIADKRYQDSVKRQEERDKRSDYKEVIKELGKFNYSAKAQTARQFGYDDDALSFSTMADKQNNTLTDLRNTISSIQNLGTESTYFDYDNIMKDVTPEDINMLKERDVFSYDTLTKAKNRFDTQRRTGMRTMSQSDKTNYENYNKLYLQAENALVKAYADIKVDIRGEDLVNASELLKSLSETGLDPTAEIKSLTKDVKRFRGLITELDNKYKISKPVEDVKLPGEAVPPLYGQGFNVNLPEGETTETFYTSDQLLDSGKIDSPSSALNVEEQAEAMYTLASATPDSPEYKEAEAKLGNMDSLNILESKPLPGLGGLIERLSVAGQERAETGEGIRGIRPESRVFDLPPIEDPTDPEYVDRVIDQFDRKVSQLKTLTLNPEQYKGTGASDKVNQINANLKARDTLVAQIKELYNKMPKTKKFQSQLRSIKSILEDNPTGLEAFLDTEARGGRGEFKFKKGKVSKEDQELLAQLNNILDFKEEPEQQQEAESTIENLIKAIAPIRADAPSGIRVPQN